MLGFVNKLSFVDLKVHTWPIYSNKQIVSEMQTFLMYTRLNVL